MEDIITKIDNNTIGIEKMVMETKTYEQLLAQKLVLEQQMENNILHEERCRIENEEKLAELNFQISKADKMGVVVKPQP